MSENEKVVNGAGEQELGLEYCGPDSEIVDAGMIVCRRCSCEKYPHKNNKHLCVECVKAENNLVSHRRRHNEDWIAEAKAAEVELWERQPRETDREWQIWLSYRDQYPSKKPTFVDVAESLTTTVGNVRSVGYRWDYPIRMQAWAKYVDNLTATQRQKEILGMNARHISMANKLNEKLERVIENIDVHDVSPTALSSLMKMASDLERKAQIGTVDTGAKLADLRDEAMGKEIAVKEQTTKKEDLQEVVDILIKAGALGAVMGIKKTTVTTTEVITDDSIECECEDITDGE